MNRRRSTLLGLAVLAVVVLGVGTGRAQQGYGSAFGWGAQVVVDDQSQSFVAAAARHSQSLGLREHMLGDLNCDGVVDFDDINPFVLALVNPAGYEAHYPACSWLNADINRDGLVNFDDINPFVACLVAGGCS